MVNNYLMSALAVFAGGGLGSVMRYGVQLIIHERLTAYSFPWATFAVNIAGSFMIGLFYAFSDRFNFSQELRLLLTAGICGGFTTFSTFSNDIIALMRQGSTVLCLVYAVASVLCGVLACLVGASLYKA